MEVAPGVHWLRMPLPMALDHINLWLIEDGPGWTLIDTGISSGLSKKMWSQVIEEHLGGRPINRIIVTHFHPDHVGMAGWLVAKTGAEFCMPRTEWLYARVLTIDTSEKFTDGMVEYYRRAGGSAPRPASAPSGTSCGHRSLHSCAQSSCSARIRRT